MSKITLEQAGMTKWYIYQSTQKLTNDNYITRFIQ